MVESLADRRLVAITRIAASQPSEKSIISHNRMPAHQPWSTAEFTISLAPSAWSYSQRAEFVAVGIAEKSEPAAFLLFDLAGRMPSLCICSNVS